ncbi:hypothetical protein DRO55_05760 [Candidatus Bathyarchaeota archaeon]|nr:MAG: hypothetical protein DRO55_05760 [Candidatus Bathyarchaeota archaeon]
MDSYLLPLLTSFTLVFMAELGDKTQLATIMLSSRASGRSVFTGAMLAFLLVDGVSALAGGGILRSLPFIWVDLASGALFILFGVLSLLGGAGRVRVEGDGVTILKTFSIVSIMELGDKTQLASIILAAELGSPVSVVAGMMLAFASVTGLGVLLGTKLLRLMPERYLRVGCSLLFVFFGILFIFRAFSIWSF